MRTQIKTLLQNKEIGTMTKIKGWIRTKRVSKQTIFLTINDGSCQQNLQAVFHYDQIPEAILKQLNTGASVTIYGTLVPSKGQDQALELQGEQLSLLGNAPDYPIQPKAHSLEYLRKLSHLRFRTQTFGAIFRIRHAICYAIHQFFHENGFYYIHSPIITGIDAEGAGAMFQVTSLDLSRLTKHNDGTIDFKEDFFEKQANLTVSGQLSAEAAAMGLGAVYTFGPTFRAEHSNTKRHLAEFWMVEPEVAFNDLQDNIQLAENLLKFLLNFVLQNNTSELAWLNNRTLSNITKQDKAPLLEQLHQTLEQPFVRITYTEAIDILKHANKNKSGLFVYPIDTWGIDLQSEHEQYLVEKHFKKPVVVTDYPKEIKAFYMRQNDDQKTVAAMDILFPGVGEIIGGSQREERLEYLIRAMQRIGIQTKALDWYLDTRRFGNVPHSGFGLGLERLIMFVTGMENVRDVIPFPRTPGHADC